MKGVLIGIGAIALIGVMMFATTYNSIVVKQEAITAKWAQVESQLQRRNDLIDNLVHTVKGYGAHEMNVFEDVTRARSQWMNAETRNDKLTAASGLDSAISRLLMITENYPQLKADQAFLKLMDELAGTENRIAVERMRYNEAVRAYNISVRQFPGNMIAGMYGFRVAKEYFKADAKATSVPAVTF